MWSFGLFKEKVIELRKKVEEFKDNQMMASEAISFALDSIPEPFGKFFGVVWSGLEKQIIRNSKHFVVLKIRFY